MIDIFFRITQSNVMNKLFFSIQFLKIFLKTSFSPQIFNDIINLSNHYFTESIKIANMWSIWKY